MAVLQIPYFQQKMLQAATGYLENKIGTPVKIQSVAFQPFNAIILNNMFLEDQAGDTLFFAENVAAGFEFLPLFKKQFRFSSVGLHSFTVYLSKATSGAPLNIQYIMEAFKSKKNTPPATIDLNIQELSLDRGTFSYRVKDAGKTPNKFNGNDILITGLTTKIRLNELTDNRLDAVVNQLCFNEKSGLTVKKMAFDVRCRADSTYIKRMELTLPHSRLLLTDISANYNPLSDHKDWTKTRFNLPIAPSSIQLQDLSPLVPAFAYFKEILKIQGHASGTLNNLQLTDFQAKDGKDLTLAVNASVRNLNSDTPNAISVNGSIKKAYLSTAGLQKMSDNFRAQSVPLPAVVQRLGAVTLNGKMNGTMNDLTAFVSVETGIGNVQADVNFGTGNQHFLKGKISSTELNLQKLLDSSDFGMAQFSVDLNTVFHNQQDIKGTVDAVVNPLDYKAYRYENIHLAGNFTADSFKGKLQMESPDGQIAVDGFALLRGKNSQFHFSAQVTDLLLDKLHLDTGHDQSKLSLHAEADFQGNDADLLLGHLSLLNLQFSSAQGDYALNQFSVHSQQNGEHRQWNVQSDILNGNLEGKFSPKQLPHALKQSLAHYLPSLFPADKTTQPADDMNLQWDFAIRNTQKLSEILHLPIIFSDSTQITGAYSNAANLFQLHACFPQLTVAGNSIENGKIDAHQTADALTLNINGTKWQKGNSRLILSAEIKAENDAIHSSIRWNDNVASKYKGELDFITQLAYSQENKFPDARMEIQPSEMIFNDSVWTLSATKLQYIADKFSVDHFQAQHDKQIITIHGATSHNEADKLLVGLQKVDLDYIFKSLAIKSLTFGGIATGQVRAQDLFQTRQLSTDLDIRRFSFNNTLFGDLDLHGRWDDARQGIEMIGRVVKNDSSSVDIEGFIYPVKEELSIYFDAHKADAAFLRKYLNKIMQDMSGELTGRLHLFGDLNDPTVEGKAYAENVHFNIEFLNTHYSFTDSIYLKSNEIYFKNLRLIDDFGNHATVNGSVYHNLFDNFKFSATLNYTHFQVFNATPRTSPNFYGTAFGTGTATIKGTEELVMMDVSLQNNEKTALTFNLMQQPDITEYDFINFVQRHPQKEKKTLPPVPIKNTSKTEIRLNLLVNANTSATLDMIMDPVTGDKISSTGSGNLQVQYGTKLPLKVFGNYQIEKGKYNFSFQQAFIRHFEIEEGSSVNFYGDPLTADLNIQAAYTVSANLGDLDQQLVQSDELRLSTRNSIPVNCVLLLSGALEQPQIKFDLKLPGATEELTRQVKSYIRTDDMMNRQIIYLLLMGRFYTAPEYARNDTRTGNDLSFLTSTLSAQLTSFLGSLSNTVQVGTHFHQSYEGEDASTEVEVLLSSNLLNNRLIINGNFGYVDKAYFRSDNESPLIGDFDVEYKLTPRGDIRLKGFNHYNYRNYFSLTPEMTQGFGIIFRRDFNNFKDLVQPLK